MILRDYQNELKSGVYAGWNAGHRNVMVVSPTGSGKTAIKAAIFKECAAPACAIAHRQELVSQISNALAEAGVHHRIIAPKPVIAFCIGQHIKKFGRSYHHAQALIAVAGIDTLLRRAEELVQWLNAVKIWDIDEAHHVLKVNKWGKGADLFPQAFGVGFTATPLRCDKKSLGRTKSGIFDHMVVGPTVRDLIDQGYLSDFIVYAPPPSIDMSQVQIGPSGEFEGKSLRTASHNSKIVGDIVEHYLKLAPGKRGITFTVDIESAIDTAAAFNSKGVPAEAVSGKTPDLVRTAVMEKFVRGDIKQMVNCDLFGEGLDVPAVEVVSKGRPTMSLGLDRQQDGRCLRPVYANGYDLTTASGRLAAIANGPKPRGIIIDHVNNIKIHKPLDTVRAWSLDDVEKKKKSAVDEFPVRACVECFRVYEAFHPACPFCGFKPEPAGRSAPHQVDGDLIEYSPELLDQLRREAEKAVSSFSEKPKTAAEIVMARNMEFRAQAQRDLRECIALWAGVQREVYDRSDSESYRRFYHTFGIDVATAQTLGRSDAEKLTQQLRETFT